MLMSSVVFLLTFWADLNAYSLRSFTVFNTFKVWLGISSMMSYMSLFLRIMSSLASSKSVFLLLGLLSICS